MAKQEYVVIVGCGRLGVQLATHLSQEGASVVVVDSEEAAFRRLPAHFGGFQVVGDAVESAVMRQAGIEKANWCFATTDNDNVNLMVAQVAREVFAVPHVVARVYDVRHEAMYASWQIDIICPTRLSADAFLTLLRLNQGQPHQGVS